MYGTQQLGLGHSQLLTGHTENSLYIRASFSPCGRFVGSVSWDTTGYIWDLEGERPSMSTAAHPIVRLCGHRGGDVSVVEWSNADPFTVVTCGDDTTVKVWRANEAPDERRNDDAYRVRQEVIDPAIEEERQLSDELKLIVARYRNHFEGEPFQDGLTLLPSTIRRSS